MKKELNQKEKELIEIKIENQKLEKKYNVNETILIENEILKEKLKNQIENEKKIELLKKILIKISEGNPNFKKKNFTLK